MSRSLRTLALLFLAALLLPLGALQASASPASSPVQAFPTVNGDVLASTVLDLGTTRALAIGGNFTAVTRTTNHPDGTSTVTTLAAVQNLAVLRIPDGAVLYAGHADSYVRALYARSGRLYVGGDFTHLAGQPRSHIGSVTTSGWQLTGFAPAYPSTVNAITTALGSVVYAGSGPIKATPPDMSATAWALNVVGGPVKALLTSYGMYPNEDVIYVGGLFEKVGDFTHHGLLRILSRATGPVVDHTFAPALRTDSNVGINGSFDGQEVLALGWRLPDHQLLVGWGGAITNGVGTMTPTLGQWFWWRYSVGDTQAVAALPTTMVHGMHRQHINGGTDRYSEQGQKWFGTEYTPAGVPTAWDPRLAGGQPNTDGGNGGIATLAVDPVDHLLFAGGQFTGTATCPGTVYPCTAPITARKGLAAYATP